MTALPTSVVTETTTSEATTVTEPTAPSTTVESSSSASSTAAISAVASNETLANSTATQVNGTQTTENATVVEIIDYVIDDYSGDEYYGEDEYNEDYNEGDYDGYEEDEYDYRHKKHFSKKLIISGRAEDVARVQLPEFYTRNKNANKDKNSKIHPLSVRNCDPEKTGTCLALNETHSETKFSCDGKRSYCHNDCECPGHQKCCFNSCGRKECLIAVAPEPTEANPEKKDS